MPRWVYKIESITANTYPEYEKWLNELGYEGWELISISELSFPGTKSLAVFKRPWTAE